MRNVRQEKSVCGFSLKFWSEWFRTGIGSYFAGVGAVLRNGRDFLQHGAQPGLSGVRNESDRLHWHLRHAELLGWNDTKFGVKVAREGKKKKKKRVEKQFFGPGAPNQLKDKYYCFPSQTCLMIWPNLTSKHFTATLSICHTHTLTSHHSLHIISSRWRNAPPPCSLLQPSSWNHHTHTHTRRTPPEEDLHF